MAQPIRFLTGCYSDNTYYYRRENDLFCRDSDKPLRLSSIAKAEILSENTGKSPGKTFLWAVLGWAIAGVAWTLFGYSNFDRVLSVGSLFSGFGMVTGAIAGGGYREITLALTFVEGEEALCVVNPFMLSVIQRAVFNNAH